MASTVYYGVCTTEGATSTKQVKLIDSDFNFNNLKKGDILSVYFAYRNEVTTVRLALYINDVNEEHNTGGTTGKLVYNTNRISVKSGAWTDGEVVNFSYTHNGTITENPDNTYYWEIIGKPKATDSTYGDVMLDGDDNSAASIGTVKNLLVKKGADSLSYDDLTTNGTSIGKLYLKTYDTNGNVITGSPITIKTLPLPTIPTDVSDFRNDAGYLTNPLQVTIDGQKRSIIHLHTSSGNTVINSVDGNIILFPDSDQQVVVGSSSSGSRNLMVYGNIGCSGGTITAPTIKASSALAANNIGSYTSSGTITFTSPIKSTSGTNTINNLQTNGITIGSQSLPNYIASQISNTNVKNALNSWLASQLNNYLLTRRYYYGPNTNIGIDSEREVTFGSSNQYWYRENGQKKYKTGNLNLSGYDIVGIIAWEAWKGKDPYHANIYGIWWENNDPSTGILNLKVTAVTKPITSIMISVDILYKKKLDT